MVTLRYPWDPAPARPAGADRAPSSPKRRGRRPAASSPAPETAPHWLYHHLTVSGPAEHVTGFAAAARGAGVTPWRVDGAAVEESVFALALAQPANRRSLSVAGCRILAGQFRERVEAHHARAVALVGRGQACPFDLHALLPVPASILQLGPIDPAAEAWLAAHWGIRDRPRQVTLRAQATAGRRLPRHHAVVGYGFFTAGDTPHAALARIAPRWPALRFVLQPRPTG